MPAWWIHDKYASKLGISKSISEEVNTEIDSADYRRVHDYGRAISHGEWNSNYLLLGFEIFFKRWKNREAVKAFFLHHILDYIGSLVSSPSIRNDNITLFINRLISSIIRGFYSSRHEAKEMVLNSCNEIYHLLRENFEEIIADIRLHREKNPSRQRRERQDPLEEIRSAIFHYNERIKQNIEDVPTSREITERILKKCPNLLCITSLDFIQKTYAVELKMTERDIPGVAKILDERLAEIGREKMKKAKRGRDWAAGWVLATKSTTIVDLSLRHAIQDMRSEIINAYRAYYPGTEEEIGATNLLLAITGYVMENLGVSREDMPEDIPPAMEIYEKGNEKEG